jgi:hypothetical protein
LSLDRAEEQTNIGDGSNIDPMVMKLRDEQDDAGPHDWSEVKIGEDCTEQSDFSNNESENEKIQRCDTILLVTG